MAAIPSKCGGADSWRPPLRGLIPGRGRRAEPCDGPTTSGTSQGPRLAARGCARHGKCRTGPRWCQCLHLATVVEPWSRGVRFGGLATGGAIGLPTVRRPPSTSCSLPGSRWDIPRMGWGCHGFNGIRPLVAAALGVANRGEPRWPAVGPSAHLPLGGMRRPTAGPERSAPAASIGWHDRHRSLPRPRPHPRRASAHGRQQDRQSSMGIACCKTNSLRPVRVGLTQGRVVCGCPLREPNAVLV